jgi:hypothetical protein
MEIIHPRRNLSSMIPADIELRRDGLIDNAIHVSRPFNSRKRIMLAWTRAW